MSLEAHRLSGSGLSKVSRSAFALRICGVRFKADGTGDFSRYPDPPELTDPPVFGRLLFETKIIKLLENELKNLFSSNF